MKNLLVLFTLLSTTTVFADGFAKLEKGDKSLSAATPTIESVKLICPRNDGGPSCQAFGSIVRVKVTMGGCLDRMGGSFSKFEAIDGKGYLYFGATNIFNVKSMTARCVAAPTKMVDVMIPFEGKVELVNLDFTGTTITE